MVVDVKKEPIVKKYYDSLEEGKILGIKCPKCGHIEWPPIPACGVCGNITDMQWVELSGEAEIVRIHPNKPFMNNDKFAKLGDYAIGYVKLKEDPTWCGAMFTNIRSCDVDVVEPLLPLKVKAELVDMDGVTSDECAFFQHEGFKVVGWRLVDEVPGLGTKTLSKEELEAAEASKAYLTYLPPDKT